jgi:hypothetical protein
MAMLVISPDGISTWTCPSPSSEATAFRGDALAPAAPTIAALAPGCGHSGLDFQLLFQWIGLWENLQENPIFNGKIYGFL